MHDSYTLLLYQKIWIINTKSLNCFSIGTCWVFPSLSHIETIKILALIADNLNAPNKLGLTPIYFSHIKNGYQEVIEYLQSIVHFTTFCIKSSELNFQNSSYVYEILTKRNLICSLDYNYFCPLFPISFTRYI